MFKILSVAALTLALSAGGAFAKAPQCRDAKGHFIKCPAAAPAAKQVCKDAKGKFAKCGTPGGKPVK
jgi:hypothetical protein